MKFIKENWAFIVIGVVCLLVGVLALLTAFKVQGQKAIAPTAPTAQHAAEAVISCSRSLTFDTTGKEPISASDSSALLDEANLSTKSGTLQFELKDATKSATPAASIKPKTSPASR